MGGYATVAGFDGGWRGGCRSAGGVVADAGLSDQQMFVGSENFSAASLRYNRELGLRTTSKALISEASAVLAADYAGATAFSS
jgi:phosphatidylserine/phosphatidylglycerophosphate/cardiolipin synthase-like enzyme